MTKELTVPKKAFGGIFGMRHALLTHDVIFGLEQTQEETDAAMVWHFFIIFV